VNIDDENIIETTNFVSGLPGPPKAVSLLPYHGVGSGKDVKLNQSRDMSDMSEPTEQDLERIVALFAEQGLTASIGG
jgi:pyruvate-formate lyase-activating enzyme